MIRTPQAPSSELPRYSDGRTYRYLGKLDRGTVAAPGSWCGAVALGAVGDCTLEAGHDGPHQNVATGDAFEIGPLLTVDLDGDDLEIVPEGLTELEWQALLGALITNRALGTTGARVEQRGHNGETLFEFSADRRMLPESEWRGGVPARSSVFDVYRVEVDPAPRAPFVSEVAADDGLGGAIEAPAPSRCPRCHAPAYAYCLGWCPVGRTADERRAALHVHVETSSADCDGRQHGEYVDGIRDGEDELELLQRHVAFAVSPFAVDGVLRVREEQQRDYDGAPVDSGAYTDVDPVRVLDWQETTEEGFSARTVRTCYELGCEL